MSQSSGNPGGGVPPFDPTEPVEIPHPFNVEQFARETIHAIEYGDATAGVMEDRVTRIEECIAARWPRRWILWARLRREIRASVAAWDPAYIRRGDFMGRRYETVALIASQRPEARRHHPEQTVGWQRHTGWDSAETGRPGGGEHLGPPWVMPGEDGRQGDAGPGAGYLP